MKIKLSVSRKIGCAKYGSRGAGIEAEVDLPAAIAKTPEALLDAIRTNYLLLEMAVNRQLEVDTPPAQFPGPTPERSPEGQSGGQNGHCHGQDQENEREPQTGLQLLRWAEKNGLKNKLCDLRQGLGLPGFFKSWESKDVQRVLALLKQSSPRDRQPVNHNHPVY
jgi:hypothetical protein